MRRLSSKQNKCTTIEHFPSFDFRDASSSFENTSCSFKLLKISWNSWNSEITSTPKGGFITDHDDKAIVMARYSRKILDELDDQGKELLIGDMYEETTPLHILTFPMRTLTHIGWLNSHLINSKAKFESSIGTSHWNHILLKVPEGTHEAMVSGCDPPHSEGWFAREVMTLDDPIGYIYYKTTDNNDKVSLRHFEFAIEDSHLHLISSSMIFLLIG